MHSRIMYIQFCSNIIPFDREGPLVFTFAYKEEKHLNILPKNHLDGQVLTRVYVPICRFKVVQIIILVSRVGHNVEPILYKI